MANIVVNVWKCIKEFRRDFGYAEKDILKRYLKNLGLSVASMFVGLYLLDKIKYRSFGIFLCEELVILVLCIVMWRLAEQWVDFCEWFYFLEPSSATTTVVPQLPRDEDSDIEVIEEDCHCCAPVQTGNPTSEDASIAPSDPATDACAANTEVEAVEGDVAVEESGAGDTPRKDMSDSVEQDLLLFCREWPLPRLHARPKLPRSKPLQSESSVVNGEQLQHSRL